MLRRGEKIRSDENADEGNILLIETTNTAGGVATFAVQSTEGFQHVE